MEKIRALNHGQLLELAAQGQGQKADTTTMMGCSVLVLGFRNSTRLAAPSVICGCWSASLVFDCVWLPYLFMANESQSIARQLRGLRGQWLPKLS